MSTLFKSKKVTPQISIVADPYQQVREPLLNWLSGKIGKPAEQYTGQLIAPKTPEETLSLDFLRKYAGRDLPETFTFGKEEIRKILTGEYDPSKSPYYQAVKAEAARNLAETQRDIASQAAGAGRYWTGARLEQQQKAATNVTQALNTLLGQLAEAERARRLQAVPLAQSLGEYEEEAPLRTAEALQRYGALDRILQQALNEAVYREWLRATQEYPLNIAELASGYAREPYYAPTYYQPSPFSQIVSAIPTVIANWPWKNKK